MDEHAIFAVARNIHDPDARRDYVRQVCAGNAVMVQRVEALLQANEEGDSSLKSPHSGSSSNATIDHASLMYAGSMVGPYKLLQKIGEGGMGVVYMAEQTDPFKRRVAIKMIKPGIDNKQLVARFKAERQALATMEHPNVAKVLYAGKTDREQLFFVMELVKGVAITRFCDDRHFTLRERLELFLPVLQAVQHAHQKGIIHRGIKPSNVLVAEYGSRPVPKVINFGLPKTTSQMLTDEAMFAKLGDWRGAAEYRSPEQAQLNQMDVDTRSDIYSLGVLLYELLTGETPFDPQRLHSHAIDEVMRIIRDEDPPRPSAKLMASTTLASNAAHRSIQPKKLSVLVRDELDWIVMKAMEKERSQRFASTSDFAKDVERFLRQEAISSRPASSLYHLRKFVLRNPLSVVAGSLVAASCVLVFFLISWEAHSERRKAQQAENEVIAAKKRAVLAQEEGATQLAMVREHEIAAKELSLELASKNAELSRQKESLRQSHYAASMNLFPSAWKAENIQRVTDLLEEQKPAKEEVDLRGFEWYFWHRRCHPELASRPFVRGFAGRGYAAVDVGFFSGNGQRFISLGKEPPPQGSNAIEVRVLNASDGKEIARWRVPWNTATGFTSVNHEGTRLATVLRRIPSRDSISISKPSIAEVKVLDAMDGKVVFSRVIANANRCALSRDGNRLAIGLMPEFEGFPNPEKEPSEIHIWDLENPEREPLRLKGEDTFVASSLLWTPDDSLLISKEDPYPMELPQSRLSIWNTATGERCASQSMKDQFITSIALSPDGTRLAGIGRSGPMLMLGATNIYSWGGLEQNQIKLLRQDTLDERGLSINTSRVLFHPDNQRILLWGDPSGTKLFDISRGETLHKYVSSTIVNAARFSADGSRLVIVGYEKDRASIQLPETDFPTEDLVLQEWDISETNAGKLSSSTLHREQIVWSRNRTHYAKFTCNQVEEINRSQATVNQRDIVVCSKDDKEMLRFREHRQPILSLEFSFDDRYICSQAGNRYPTETLVWEAATGNVVWSRSLPNDSKHRMNRVVFGFHGTMAALPEQNATRIVSTSDWKTEIAALEGHCISFSPGDRRVITTSILEDESPTKEWKLFDVHTGSVIKAFPPSTARGLSDDGHWIAVIDVHMQEVQVWNSDTVEIKSTIPRRAVASRTVFSPDGTRIVLSTHSGTLEVWDIAKSKLIFRVEGSEPRGVPRKCIAFSPDGKRIAAAMMGEDNEGELQPTGIIKVLDASSGRELLNLSCPWRSVPDEIEFSSDGFRLTARSLPLNDDLLLQEAVNVKTWDVTPRTSTARP